MQIFIITLVVLLLFVVAMSVGVLLGGKPLKGSCGGVGAALGEEDYTCDLCGGDPNKCDEEQQKQSVTAAQNLFHDATKR